MLSQLCILQDIFRRQLYNELKWCVVQDQCHSIVVSHAAIQFIDTEELLQAICYMIHSTVLLSQVLVIQAVHWFPR